MITDDTDKEVKHNCYIKWNLDGDQLFFNSVPIIFEQFPNSTSLRDLIGFPLPNTKTTPTSETDDKGNYALAQLYEALVISLVYDVNFLLEAFPRDTELTLVCPPKYRHKNSQIKSEHNGRPFKVRQYPGQATMQAKLWLFFYSSHLRVVISSANMNPIDWNAMTENFWYQDFPLISEHDKVVSDIGLAFEQDLTHFVRCLQSVDHFVPLLSKYDYSRVKVHLVTSVPGNHSGGKLHRYGHMRMRHLLWKQPILEKIKHVPIEFQASNIGNLHEEWFTELYHSFRGIMNSEKVPTQHLANLIYPSSDYMSRCSLTAENGWYFYWLDKFTFSRPFLCDVEDPNFPGLFYHSKIYSCCTDEGLGWIYAGGHNLSGSAWGKLSEDQQVLTINNFEIGVLFVANEALVPSTEQDPKFKDNFRLKFFVPFPRHPKKYREEDSPWVR